MTSRAQQFVRLLDLIACTVILAVAAIVVSDAYGAERDAVHSMSPESIGRTQDVVDLRHDVP